MGQSFPVYKYPYPKTKTVLAAKNIKTIGTSANILWHLLTLIYHHETVRFHGYNPDKATL